MYAGLMLQGRNSIKNIPPEYYKMAIKEAEATFKDCKYAVFFRQHSGSLENTSPIKGTHLALSNSENNDQGYSDLWLIVSMQAFIMANSTFSRWGSMAGRREGLFSVCARYSSEQEQARGPSKDLFLRDWKR
jgi:hypothetical protein